MPCRPHVLQLINSSPEQAAELSPWISLDLFCCSHHSSPGFLGRQRKAPAMPCLSHRRHVLRSRHRLFQACAKLEGGGGETGCPSILLADGKAMKHPSEATSSFPTSELWLRPKPPAGEPCWVPRLGASTAPREEKLSLLCAAGERPHGSDPHGAVLKDGSMSGGVGLAELAAISSAPGPPLEPGISCSGRTFPFCRLFCFLPRRTIILPVIVLPGQ